MSKRNRLVAAVVLIVAAIFGEQALDFVKNIDFTIFKPDTPVVVPVDEPSLEYKALVKDIVAIDIAKEDAAVVQAFFSELASVIESDPGFLKTTGQFRDFNVMAGAMNFAGLDMKDKYPALGEDIDQALIDAIGKENVSLDQTKRQNLVSALRAVAWGVTQ
jgi:hypothetical protein